MAARSLGLRRLTEDTGLPPEATPKAMLSFVGWVLGNEPTERYDSSVRNGETLRLTR